MDLGNILDFIDILNTTEQQVVEEPIEQPQTFFRQSNPVDKLRDLFIDEPIAPIPTLDVVRQPRRTIDLEVRTRSQPREKVQLPKQVKAQPQLISYVPKETSVQNIHPLIKKYFPKSQWLNAQRVMQAESSGNPSAIGDRYPIAGVYAPSYGLFQIRGLPGRPSPRQLLDPEFNVKYAAQLFKQQGFQPWYNTARKLGLL